jgi:hypothetical protein
VQACALLNGFSPTISKGERRTAVNPRNLSLLVLAVAASHAWGQQVMSADKAERCATRLSIALTGRSPSSRAMSNPAPQSDVDAYVSGADFQERFSRFINAAFNNDPGATAAEDPAYYMTKYVLQNDLPWQQLFIGPYRVDLPSGSTTPAVMIDPNGLGYFRSPAWMKRYAGNEEQGIKISTGYRMMNNTLGLVLVASTNAPGADITLTGRQGPGCRACHFDSWFALDKVASILSRKQVDAMGNVTFGPSPATEADILGGMQIHNDRELATALVSSEAFRFRACRLAFIYLYGRPEVTCEGPVFDRCMDAFKATGKITAAVSTVAKDATFCQ